MRELYRFVAFNRFVQNRLIKINKHLVGIAVLFAALPAGEAVAALTSALPAAFGWGVAPLSAAPCESTDTLDAGAFFWLFA